jgi:arylformamidase
MSKLIDLTHSIEAGMPVFPGTEPPVLDQANTIARDGFAEKKLSMYSHTGTHMDAPAHMLDGGKTLDAFDVASFYGHATLIDVRSIGQSHLGVDIISRHAEQLKRSQILILRTGWAERWGREDYFMDFPALSEEAARLVIRYGIKGIGIDAISIDRMGVEFPVHHILFEAGVFVVENLTNLDRVGQEFTFICLPLKILNADGAPVRAVGLID